MVRLRKRVARKPRVDATEDDVEYEVEGVIGKRVDRNNVIQYQVKWKGYDEVTWVSTNDLNCPEFVAAYELRCSQDESARASLSKSSAESAEVRKAGKQPRKRQDAPTPSAKAVEEATVGKPYDVEGIVASRENDGKIEYQIKWKHFDYVTWVAEDNINCPELIAAYERRAKDAEQDGEDVECRDAAGEQVGADSDSDSDYKEEHLECRDAAGEQVGADSDSDYKEEHERVAPNDGLGGDLHAEEQVRSAASDQASTDVSRNEGKDAEAASTPHQDTSTNDGLGGDHAEEQVRSAASDQASTDVSRNEGKDAEAASTPHQHTSTSIENDFTGQFVAFSPHRCPWLKNKAYKVVKEAYLLGRICHAKKRKSDSSGKKVWVYELKWLDTQFNNLAEWITVDFVQQGVDDFKRVEVELRREMEESDDDDERDDEDDAETGGYEQYRFRHELPATMKEVESIKSMRFDPRAELRAPPDLYEHESGGTQTRVKNRFKEIFRSSATASFFAYLPMSFWKKVLQHTNAKLRVRGKSYMSKTPFTMDELMRFFGILFYMELFPKGEYSNFWGTQEENEVLETGINLSLDKLMPMRRFKALRSCLSFADVTPVELVRDPAAAIRPLLTMLKKTGANYVDVGRNIAIDEASVACRSKRGRHLIVYNPKKPTGKYHFRIYMASCSTSWIALNFRLHCASDIKERLSGLASDAESAAFKAEIQVCSDVRKCVLEVIRPFFHTKRVVNTDNYYTSVQLLQALKLKGLYARGTVRSTSKHFPKHVLLEKDHCARGDYRMAVSSDYATLAASWCDGNVVAMISNADASVVTTVDRRVRQNIVTVQAPACVGEYNRHMQGVDRLDQVRARFSLADGHSFVRWHVKLAMAVIDIARCNAYQTRKMVVGGDSDRDPHRSFMKELARQLINGSWKDCVPDENVLFGVDTPSTLLSPSATVPTPSRLPTATMCTFVSSTGTRKTRECIICRLEGANPRIVTIHCLQHGVNLCSRPNNVPGRECFCPNEDWSCWDKYHKFYMLKKVFTARGNIKRSSALYKRKRSDLTLPAGSVPSRMSSPLAPTSTVHGVSPAVSTEYSFSPMSTDYGASPAVSTEYTTPVGERQESEVESPVLVSSDSARRTLHL